MSDEAGEKISGGISLSELCKRLKAAGVDLALPSLSEFIKTGDIAEQLRVGGKANRLEIAPDVAEILAGFFPLYKANRGRLPQAPEMLRSFLKARIEPEGNALEVVSDFSKTPNIAVSEFSETPNALLLEVRRTLAALLPPAEDELLTVKDAAARYGVSPNVLRGLRVKDGGRLKVKRSDVLKYIAGL